MFTRLPLPWEALLLLVLLVIFALVVRAVRGRRRLALPGALPTADAADLPVFDTDVRVRGTVRRIFRDPQQRLWLVTAEVGPARYTFCATDYQARKNEYEALVNKPAEIVLFGLSTLEAGGADAIRDRIKDADKVVTPNTVALTQAGQFPNDYAVIGRIAAARSDTWDDLPLTVYRTQVVHAPRLQLVLDLAVPAATQNADSAAAPPLFAPGAMVHGSARLFGRLADSVM